MEDREAKDLVGCCGLYCGLCNKYQSTAPSRCIGCQLGEQHSWCSIWVCCVKKHGFVTCTECHEIFNCAIFVRREVAGWIPASHNLHQIMEAGLENWLEEQKGRQSLLELLLQHFNEGRSMSLFCKACSRMPLDLVSKAIAEANEKLAGEEAKEHEIKTRARLIKAILHDLAIQSDIDLS